MNFNPSMIKNPKKLDYFLNLFSTRKAVQVPAETSVVSSTGKEYSPGEIIYGLSKFGSWEEALSYMQSPEGQERGWQVLDIPGADYAPGRGKESPHIKPRAELARQIEAADAAIDYALGSYSFNAKTIAQYYMHLNNQINAGYALVSSPKHVDVLNAVRDHVRDRFTHLLAEFSKQEVAEKIHDGTARENPEAAVELEKRPQAKTISATQSAAGTSGVGAGVPLEKVGLGRVAVNQQRVRDMIGVCYKKSRDPGLSREQREYEEETYRALLAVSFDGNTDAFCSAMSERYGVEKERVYKAMASYIHVSTRGRFKIEKSPFREVKDASGNTVGVEQVPEVQGFGLDAISSFERHLNEELGFSIEYDLGVDNDTLFRRESYATIPGYVFINHTVESLRGLFGSGNSNLHARLDTKMDLLLKVESYVVGEDIVGGEKTEIRKTIHEILSEEDFVKRVQYTESVYKQILEKSKYDSPDGKAYLVLANDIKAYSSVHSGRPAYERIPPPGSIDPEIEKSTREARSLVRRFALAVNTALHSIELRRLDQGVGRAAKLSHVWAGILSGELPDEPMPLGIAYDAVVALGASEDGTIEEGMRDAILSQMSKEERAKVESSGSERQKNCRIMIYFHENKNKMSFDTLDVVLAKTKAQAPSVRDGLSGTRRESEHLTRSVLGRISTEQTKKLYKMGERIKNTTSTKDRDSAIIGFIESLGIARGSANHQVAWEYLDSVTKKRGTGGGKKKKSGDNAGAYTEGAANVLLALSFGGDLSFLTSATAGSAKSKDVPDILQVRGKDGKTYQFAKHSTAEGGYGDTVLAVLGSDGTVLETTAIEQKLHSGLSFDVPHVGDMASSYVDIMNYYIGLNGGKTVPVSETVSLIIRSKGEDVFFDTKLTGVFENSMTRGGGTTFSGRLGAQDAR